ncbi:MAG: hypothetical protein Ct9H300mP3_02320 [Gammaproteobacteria bacterium]|nr:MAG: hypothetical protein Ct9H300mP3_02320 [Gammaproteobacteria bacterium]
MYLGDPKVVMTVLWIARFTSVEVGFRSGPMSSVRAHGEKCAKKISKPILGLVILLMMLAPPA